jgi:cell division protein FtsB
MKSSTIKQSLLILFLLSLIVSLAKNILDYYKKNEFFSQFEQTIQKLEKENKEIADEIEKNRLQFSYEEVLRNKMNVTKPGEYVILLPPKGPSTVTPTPTMSNRRQWLNLYLHE